MLYIFKITIAAGTTEAIPKLQFEKLIVGTIKKVVIKIPAGHEGLAHLQVFDQETRVYPFNKEDIQGDDMIIPFDEDYFLDSPNELKFKGWNTDDLHAHTFLVYVVMFPSSVVEEKKSLLRQDIINLRNRTFSFRESFFDWLRGS